MKRSTAYFCTECSYESPKWVGQCLVCKAWNTLVEESTAPKEKLRAKSQTTHVVNLKPVDLREVDVTAECRIDTGFPGLNRVLGGGTVGDSLVSIGGDPGIGESIILLQARRNFAVPGKRVLYISGEEPPGQIKFRVERLCVLEGNLRFLSETSLGSIHEVLLREKPGIVIIDSIQIIYCNDISATPGSVNQVRGSANALIQLAKGSGTAIFIVGHVTKEGQVVGPRVLEHIVDIVLYLEGGKSSSYRILRVIKNRFGLTNEIGVLEMTERGLERAKNPSAYMLEGRPLGAGGAVAACSLEGSRPILLEVQAFVTESALGIPRRTAAGIDYNRVNLLMAILEKCCRLSPSHYDAYVDIAGGMRMNEPTVDLAAAIAMISSFRDKAVEADIVIFGEIGLSGKVRVVPFAEYRAREAAKLGLTRCIPPKSNAEKCRGVGDIVCYGAPSTRKVMHLLF